MMKLQVIPDGYKQTEVGVIPDDWSVKSIDEIAIKVGSGKTPFGGSNVYKNEGIPLVRSQNVGWGKLLLDDVAFITKEVHETFTGSELRENDILLNITGASIGRSALANEKLNGGNVNQHVCIIRVNKKNVEPKLLNSLILSTIGQDQIDSYQAGGNREGLNFSQIRSMLFPLPFDREEQTAIANALSDVDALIASIEKLITKKQAIKTATMQQLLTGKKRLPPFDKQPDGTPKAYKQTELGEIPEDWDVCKLEYAANFLDGQRRPVKSGERAKMKGMYPYYGASGIVDYVNDYIFDGEFILLGEDGENILSRSLPLAFKASGKIWVNNHAHVMQPTDYFNIDFLREYLESLDYSLLNSGTAQPKLNKQSCLNINVIKPSLDEQIQISIILSNMDGELGSLKQRLSKTQQIKQGMMQELLTGKTRLPVNRNEDNR